MTDILNAHERVWRQLGARVEDYSVPTAVARDCLFVLPGAAVVGLANARPYFAAYMAAYPDTEKRVQRILKDDQTVVIRSTVAGHNTGSLVTPTGTAEGTGREVEWDIVEWLVVEDDVIVEWRVYQDPTPYIDALNRAPGGGEAPPQACIAEVVATMRLASPMSGRPEASVSSTTAG